MTNAKRSMFIGLMAIVTFVQLGWTWSKVGHRTVAQIAEDNLLQSALDQVHSLLGVGVTLADISTWADDIKYKTPNKPITFQGVTFTGATTHGWHFIDIPIAAENSNLKDYCKNQNCAIDQIERFLTVLKNPQSPIEDRAIALKFIVHLVGDIHQPLHCADDNDHGGNGKQVKFEGRKMNLHSLWDHILQKKDEGDHVAMAKSLELAYNGSKQAFLSGSLQSWAMESWDIAKTQIYPDFERLNGIFDKSYESKYRPIVDLQLARGGYRLAVLLNDALK